MPKYTFNSEAVRGLIEHSRNAPEQGSVYGEKIDEPSLLLVKDRGVYLMSNGVPRQPSDSDDSLTVVYAHGYNPDLDDFDDWYVGGDDYAEPLPCEAFDHFLAGVTFKLKVNKNSIGIEGRG